MKSIATAMAMLALSAAPAALAQPYPSDQPYPNSQGYPGPGYQGQQAPNQGYPNQNYAPPSGQPPYAEDQNQGEAQQYDRSEDTYEQQLRQYQRDKRAYDRQRDAYDAQFEGRDASAYPPPPPPPPPPDEARPGYYRYSETIPFRDGPWEYAEPSGGWYRDHGCRLASPHEGPDAGAGRLIPVCPDPDGRYHPAD